MTRIYLKLMKCLAIIISLFLSSRVIAQNNIAIGQWRTHFSYNQVNYVVDADNIIYAASNNGLFYYDKDDNSITKITKLDGLQGGEVSALGFDKSSGLLFIGYVSGNLDIIEGHTIFNFDLTSTSQVQGSKTINYINFFGDFAYLSTDFGVLQFDLQKKEVKETWRELGINNTGEPEPLQVNMSAVKNDSIYLATSQGVIATNIINNVNRLDFRNWKRFKMTEGLPESSVAIINIINDELLAGVNNLGLFRYDENLWTSTGVLTNRTFTNCSNGERPLVVADSLVYKILPSWSAIQINVNLADTYSSALNDKNGHLWLGSYNNGLINVTGASFESYMPSGPRSDYSFRLNYVNGKIYGLSGGFDENGSALNIEDGFYTHSNGQWKNYNSHSVEFQIPEFKDIVAVEYFNKKTYIASMGYGLLEITDDGKQKIYDETNSPLINTNPPYRGVKVPMIKVGYDGLWVLNYGSNNILKLNNQGTWETFAIPNTAAAFSVDMLVLDDLIWMIVNPTYGGGIVVYDVEGGNTRYLTTTSGNGGLPGNDVYSLALDKNDYVWVGTDFGVSVFTNPRLVMSGSVDGIEPIFENRQLLRDETVLDIEVDGGNRKWMATNSGVWLFDQEANRQIEYFTSANTPLAANEVLDVDIDDKTGEVFFATSQGLVSWRGKATEAKEVNGAIKIFPNPVPKDFKGIVGISGLVENADVKITDVSGKLIFKTKANGGTATWNVTGYNGKRAATGIYLIFSASEDGEETFVGKIAVVN